MSSEAALLEEINRLSGAINRRKTTQPPPQPTYRGRGRGGPPYKPSYRSRGGFTEYTPISRPGVAGPSQQTREVVVDGVTFQSNGKTLVRKTGTSSSTSPGQNPSPTLSNTTAATGDTAVPSGQATQTTSATTTATTSPTLSAAIVSNKPLVRTRNGLIAVDRYKQIKSKSTAKPPPRQPYARPITGYPKRAPPGRNLTLNKKKSVVKSKKWDKQCKHFTMTGAPDPAMPKAVFQTHNGGLRLTLWPNPLDSLSFPYSFIYFIGMCGRGLTCKYQHDPTKIALCPLFLAEKCPYKDTPEECSLSHDPTPERTPICVRFNSTGHCYKGSDCLYPHVRVGAKTGICRDFAVLGYCEKGAGCEASHLKECPDFAETGVCKRMGVKGANGCHLPHVIRANQKKIGVATKAQVVAAAASKDTISASPVNPTTSPPTASARSFVKKRYIPPGMVLGETSSAEPQFTTGEQPGMYESAPSSSAGDAAGALALLSADEFISLTFEESDDEDEDEGEDEDEDEDDEEEDEDEDEEDEDADAEEVDKEMQLADDDDTGDAW